MQTKAPERILGRVRSWLKLSYRKNGVDSSVIRYFELVGKSTYPFDDLEGANVLLGQFLSYPDRERNRAAFMKLKHSPISNFYKQGLVLPIVVGFLVCKGKRYGVCCVSPGDEGVG